MPYKKYCYFFISAYTLLAMIQSDAQQKNNDLISIKNNPFLYSAAFSDNESRLEYLNARYYAPAIPRFIQWDTYDLVNRYGYAPDGNPVMDEDPSGHCIFGNAVEKALFVGVTNVEEDSFSDMAQSILSVGTVDSNIIPQLTNLAVAANDISEAEASLADARANEALKLTRISQDFVSEEEAMKIQEEIMEESANKSADNRFAPIKQMGLDAKLDAGLLKAIQVNETFTYNPVEKVYRFDPRALTGDSRLNIQSIINNKPLDALDQNTVKELMVNKDVQRDVLRWAKESCEKSVETINQVVASASSQVEQEKLRRDFESTYERMSNDHQLIATALDKLTASENQ